MSMKATERLPRFSATFFATVDFPEPDPPAIPMMSGFDTKRNLRVDGTVGGMLCIQRSRVNFLSEKRGEKKSW